MQFLESVAHTLYLKARLKLNIKRLYAADGRAVHELLKVTDLLFAASQRATTDAEVRRLHIPKPLLPPHRIFLLLKAGVWHLQVRTIPGWLSIYMLQEISRGTESAFEELGHMDKTVKCVREAVVDINRAGQEIHAHLAWEPELSTTRQQILAQQTDKADIERAVQVLYHSIPPCVLWPLVLETCGGCNMCHQRECELFYWFRMQ